ncbi:MAG: deoxyribodipyrimidine photo-lyase [Burkholderiales bacterium]
MASLPYDRALVWFRRDLRDFDHAALHQALSRARAVYGAFVFDREILDALPRQDRRVEFIRESLVELDAALAARGGGLVVRHGLAREAIPDLARELRADAVFTNRDYEPAAIARDEAVAASLDAAGIAFETFKDQVIFERGEVVSQAGRPYTVFTPYRNAWTAALTPAHLRSFRSPKGGALARPARSTGVPSLADIGFETTDLRQIGVRPGMSGGAELFSAFREHIDDYRKTRDIPSAEGTSRLSVHLRFGTVSVRELTAYAHSRSLERGGEGAQTWLSELVWREFFAQILWHRPDVVDRCFRPEYEALQWRNDRGQFAAWCEGRTGYPIVDAAMRELNTTGFMHNRLRMVAASFLVKDLLVDWRWGERYFARQLLDYDLASNNGNWQWAASTGCDAQPYFRIFNPVSQSERFDPESAFIRRFVPELRALDADEIHEPWKVPPMVQGAKGVAIGRDYPAPIVDHAVSRAQALAMFKAVGRP